MTYEFNASSFRDRLQTHTLGRNLVFFQSTNSTQEQAKAALRVQPLPTGTLFLASHQTHGRGTGSNRWIAGPNTSVLASLIAGTNHDLSRKSMNAAIAVAISRVLRKEYSINAWIKWPNDIWIDHAKIAGILVEATGSDLNERLIVGFGVNVNQHEMDQSDSPKVSIRMASGKEASVEDVCLSLLKELEYWWFTSARAIDHSAIHEQYLQLCPMKNQQVGLKQGDTEEKVFVEDIDADFRLVVRYADARTEKLESRGSMDITIPPTFKTP